jgi:hypothetical protein
MPACWIGYECFAHFLCATGLVVEVALPCFLLSFELPLHTKLQIFHTLGKWNMDVKQRFATNKTFITILKLSLNLRATTIIRSLHTKVHHQGSCWDPLSFSISTSLNLSLVTKFNIQATMSKFTTQCTYWASGLKANHALWLDHILCINLTDCNNKNKMILPLLSSPFGECE